MIDEDPVTLLVPLSTDDEEAVAALFPAVTALGAPRARSPPSSLTASFAPPSFSTWTGVSFKAVEGRGSLLFDAAELRSPRLPLSMAPLALLASDTPSFSCIVV